MTFDIFQIALAAFGVTSLVLLAFSRILIGCVFGLVAYSVWIYVAYQAEQPGVLVLVCLSWLTSLLGIIGRIPRRRVVQDEEPEQTYSHRAEVKRGIKV